MKSASPILLSTLVLLGITATTVEWNTISNLRRENVELKNRVEQLVVLGESNSNLERGKLNAEVEQLRAQLKDLPRLRGELQQLRNSTNELAKLRDENRQLKSRAGAPAPATSSSTAQATSYKKENWAFAGYATPDSALQSVVWGMSQGDLKTVLAGASPEFQAMLAKEWENKTEAQIAEEGRKEMEKTTGFRILDRKTVSDDEVVLDMFIEGENHHEKMSMKRYGSEWKLAGPARE
jgi:hypothetical protein